VAKRKQEADPSAPDPAKVRKGLIAKAMVNLHDKLKRGETLKKHEFDLLDAYLEGEGPGSLEQARNAPPPAPAGAAGEPADVAFKRIVDGCELLGIHKNTGSNWNAAGMRPPGESPYSLKAWCLILRRGGKLSECKPTTPRALAVWRWAFKAGSEESYDPDDPIHDPPANWKEEQARQSALRERDQRRDLRLDIETKEKDRLRSEVVADGLKALARNLSGHMAILLRVPNEMQELTPKQVADLGDRIQQAIADVRAKHAAEAPRIFEAMLRD
jgi:hypothetical protein